MLYELEKTERGSGQIRLITGIILESDRKYILYRYAASFDNNGTDMRNSPQQPRDAQCWIEMTAEEATSHLDEIIWLKLESGEEISFKVTHYYNKELKSVGLVSPGFPFVSMQN